MITQSHNKIVKSLFILLLVFISIYTLHLGVFPLGRDSIQYVNGSGIRSAGYPFFLKFNHILFGNWEYRAVIITQLILGITASIYASKSLQRLIDLPEYFIYLFTIIFLIPYFFGDYKFANHIMTEGLSYPLYLFAFSNFLKGIVLRQYRPIYTYILTLFILVLLRPQMMFTYILGFLGWCYVALYFNGDKQKKILLLLTLISIALLTNITDKTYHYFKNGFFGVEPMFNFSLVVAPLYFSIPADAILIKDPAARKAFIEISNDMQYRHLGYSFFNKSLDDNVYDHYVGAYNSIAWFSAYGTYTKHNITNWHKINSLSKEMAYPLLKKYWRQYIYLYFQALKNKFGGYYWFLFWSLLLISSLTITIKYQQKYSLILFFTLSACFINYSSVAIVEMILRRYSSYTESFQLCVMLGLSFVILINEVTTEKTNYALKN